MLLAIPADRPLQARKHALQQLPKRVVAGVLAHACE